MTQLTFNKRELVLNGVHSSITVPRDNLIITNGGTVIDILDTSSRYYKFGYAEDYILNVLVKGIDFHSADNITVTLADIRGIYYSHITNIELLSSGLVDIDELLRDTGKKNRLLVAGELRRINPDGVVDMPSKGALLTEYAEIKLTEKTND